MRSILWPMVFGVFTQYLMAQGSKIVSKKQQPQGRIKSLFHSNLRSQLVKLKSGKRCINSGDRLNGRCSHQEPELGSIRSAPPPAKDPPFGQLSPGLAGQISLTKTIDFSIMNSKDKIMPCHSEYDCWTPVNPRMGESSFACSGRVIWKEGINETSICRNRCFGLFAFIRKRTSRGFSEQTPGTHRPLRGRRFLRPHVPDHGGQGRVLPESSTGGGCE